jgi:hypothetical protein
MSEVENIKATGSMVGSIRISSRSQPVSGHIERGSSAISVNDIKADVEGRRKRASKLSFVGAGGRYTKRSDLSSLIDERRRPSSD